MKNETALTVAVLGVSAALFAAGALHKPPEPSVNVAADAASRATASDQPRRRPKLGERNLTAAELKEANDDLTIFVREKLHRYTALEGDEFLYAREPSHDPRSLGVSSLHPLRVRYLGKTDGGSYQFLLNNNGLLIYAACSEPCTLMHASAGLGSAVLPPTLDARSPSVLHDVFLDASVGSLDVAISSPYAKTSDPAASVAP